MIQEVVIRNAKAEDMREIQEVFYKTWLATYPNADLGITTQDIDEMFKDSFSKTTLDDFAQKLQNLPSHVKFIVVTVNNKVIGLSRIYIKEEYNQLNAIYVLPEHQGKGIGTMLWNECLKYFDKSKKIIVQVATYNTSAIMFYQKLGFKDNGKRFSEERHRMPISKVLIPELEMEM